MLRQRPVSQVLTVKCDRMHIGDRILLISDAAHAVSLSIGQGRNVALQDVQVFAQVLEQSQSDWAQALPAFASQRLPDVLPCETCQTSAFPARNG
jgi:kynurenine 3-monooxygenase